MIFTYISLVIAAFLLLYATVRLHLEDEKIYAAACFLMALVTLLDIHILAAINRIGAL